MTNDDIHRAILAELARIAPEADLVHLDAAADLRDALDLDSMDILHLAQALHASLGVDVPEGDYAKIVTLRGCEAYVAAHAPRAP